MAWPFLTSQQNSLRFPRLDRGRKETEVLFTEQKQLDRTLRQCLSSSLFVFQSVCVCLKPPRLIHQRFSPPACTPVHSHASLGSEFPFLLHFLLSTYFIHLLCPPSLNHQYENCQDSGEHPEKFLILDLRISVFLLKHFAYKCVSINELDLFRNNRKSLTIHR